MVKKIESPTRESEISLLVLVEDSTRTAWLAGAAVYSTLQNVRSGVADRLAHELKRFRTGARARVGRAVNDVRQTVSATRSHIDKRIDDAITVPLDFLGIPTQKDVDKLARRVAELNAAVKRLAHEHSSKQTTRPA
jgi:poly(hydroxyalkanoate) granule-associated protein